MAEITEVSVEFASLAIRHLDETYGPRLAGEPLVEFMDLLGRSEAVYRTLPRVREGVHIMGDNVHRGGGRYINGRCEG